MFLHPASKAWENMRRIFIGAKGDGGRGLRDDGRNKTDPAPEKGGEKPQASIQVSGPKPSLDPGYTF